MPCSVVKGSGSSTLAWERAARRILLRVSLGVALTISTSETLATPPPPPPAAPPPTRVVATRVPTPRAPLPAAVVVGGPARANPRLPFGEVLNVTRHKEVDGELFHQGTKALDLFDQGRLGDCYFLAAAAAIAHTNPSVIRDAFTEHADGTVSVRLFVRDGNHLANKQTIYRTPLKAIEVQVDRRIAISNGKPVYVTGHDSEHPELWPAILEKAFAKVNGSYGRIVGGWPARAMEMLSGKESQEFVTAGAEPNDIYRAMRSAMEYGKPIAASTYPPATFAKTMGELERSDPQSPDLDTLRAMKSWGIGSWKTPALWGSKYRYDDSGVVENHSYTVLGVTEKNGRKFVILRNPWGSYEPPSTGIGTAKVKSGEGDGVFQLPLSLFTKLYVQVDIGG